MIDIQLKLKLDQPTRHYRPIADNLLTLGDMYAPDMETIVFGNLKDTGIEVVERDDRYFVRYDAGSHQMVWREDEISSEELAAIQLGKAGEYRSLLEVQKRLTKNGEDPQAPNWTPPTAVH